jgi:hypothetical protein
MAQKTCQHLPVGPEFSQLFTRKNHLVCLKNLCEKIDLSKTGDKITGLDGTVSVYTIGTILHQK